MSLGFFLSHGARVRLTAVAATLLLAGGSAFAAEPEEKQVDLFAAIEAGQVEAKFIPRDSTTAKLLLENKTKQPLSVALPPAFAAVPVLAQFGQQGFGQGLGQGLGQQGGAFNSPQNVGGGFPPMGNGLLNIAGPGQQNPFLQQPGFFSIPAEKVGKLKLTTVCLSFGQPDPRPRIPYEVRPLAEVSEAPGVAEVCALLAQGKVSQRVAQLAAWNLANDRPWEELAGITDKAAFGRKPRYRQRELALAKELAEQAAEAAAEATSDRLSDAR